MVRVILLKINQSVIALTQTKSFRELQLGTRLDFRLTWATPFLLKLWMNQELHIFINELPLP